MGESEHAPVFCRNFARCGAFYQVGRTLQGGFGRRHPPPRPYLFQPSARLTCARSHGGMRTPMIWRSTSTVVLLFLGGVGLPLQAQSPLEIDTGRTVKSGFTLDGRDASQQLIVTGRDARGVIRDLT